MPENETQEKPDWKEKIGEKDPAKRKKRTGKPGQSFPNRLLQALAEIFEGEDASTPEKLQAMELSIKVLPMRKTPKRKTDKEKLVEQAMKKSIETKEKKEDSSSE